jgi:dephospho-CoA kinase
MYTTGITGTIASGKTSVSILLKRRGFPVFNSDQYARMATHAGNPCHDALVEVIGKECLEENGDIDRKKMADVIFHDEIKRKAVNAIVHPYVKEGLQNFFRKQNTKLVFAEVPLLFEAGWEDLFDEICVVTCSKETAVARMMRDRDYTKEQALARYESQLDPQVQTAKADQVIVNDGSLQDLDHEINLWIRDLRRKERLHGKETA